MSFFTYLNNQHINISFTYEKANNGSLSFLDILIKNTNSHQFITSVFRKKTYTGLLTNFLSYVPFTYKLALVKTLINRAYHICNNWQLFHQNIIELKRILGRNMFPPKLVDNTLKNYLDKVNENKIKENSKLKNESYFKLPYVGDYSLEANRKISEICRKYCKTLEIKISYSMTKVGDYFSVKSRIPDYLKSFVVYYFVCASCKASYVGETTRYFSVRVQEHLNKSSGASNVFSHLQQKSDCRNKCDENCFKIIDSARTKFTLKVKEALHIQRLSPTINKQKNHLSITITV